MATTIEKLLATPKRVRQEKQIQFKSWTDADGEPVVFTIRELTYSEIADIKKVNSGADISAAIIATGVATPNLRDDRLQQLYGVATPYDLIRRMLRPGEIEELQIEIERLAGYRTRTLELIADIEKN